MLNFGPLAAEIGPVVWGTPANFNGFRVFAALLHDTPLLGVILVLSIYLLLFSSPNLSRRRLDVCHTSTHGLSANVGCRSVTCCTQLAENSGRKKSPKKSPSGHHSTTLSGYIFETKVHIDNRKNLLSSNTSSRCPTIW